MKHIKMLLYGEPGVGKSVFASKSPKPFFITTDGNYEWLEDFGADPNAYKQVYSWEEAKKAFAESYDNYDTIVVDLLEDLFKWDEQEYCVKARIDHVSDVGYGKGYDITRNEFFLEISKLLSKPKNVILISHGITFTTKDRRGVEHTRYAPSSRIPDKVLDMIEGRLRYCLRCYQKAEETADGQLIKTRWLSLIPKENEFGIIRGVDENKLPSDIPLDWNEFAKAINFDSKTNDNNLINSNKNLSQKSSNDLRKNTEKKEVEQPKAEEKKVTVTEANPLPFDTASDVTNVDVQEAEVKKEEPKKEETKKEVSNADKIAAIKAKLAALKANKGE